MVVLLETPGVVDGDRGFPGAFDGADAYLVITGGIVIAEAMSDAAADQALRLEHVHQVGELLALLERNVARGIEPDEADRPVVGQKLADLRNHLLVVILLEILGPPVGKIPFIAHGIGLMPVLSLRIVEAEPEALALTGG